MTVNVDEAVTELAAGLLLAVEATGVLEGADMATVDHAGNVMREELRRLVTGGGEYGEALHRVGEGSLHAGEAAALVVTNCTEKILAYRVEAVDA